MSEPYRQSAKRRLATLEGIRVASPCDVPWDDMKGDGRIRLCARCQKNVFNISGMTRVDAESLVHEHLETNKEICVRLYKRDDGTVLTADCPVGVRAKIVRRLQNAALVGGLLAIVAALALKYLGTKVQSAGSMGAMSVMPDSR